MELKTVAQMSDLEDAIMESSLAPKTQRWFQMICQAKFRSNCIGEYIVGVFTGGLYQGEVVKVDGENVTVDFLKPVFLKQNNEESS